jgi:outer membrane protein OmpA-like peptidoglycan-associated protein
MINLIKTVFLVFILSIYTSFSQNDSLNTTSPRQFYIDSLLSLQSNQLLSPDFYKKRYNSPDLLYKVTDNQGDGFDSLYGTRNLRTILHGVAYRGGANNYFHKTAKRHNHNPLPDDGIRNLCNEGFSASIYLYRNNFDSAPLKDTCGCLSGGWNEHQYYQYDYNDQNHIYKMLELVYKSATNDSIGPIYLHCWNGWHASGLLSALCLRQFCGFDKWEAINYWDLGTDGANNSPRYQVIREIIKNFEPFPDLMITDELGNMICPSMPENIDSSELYIDIEHLVYVPESLPIGFSIVLHNISFGAGRADFPKPNENIDLQNLLSALEQQPELKIEIGGYTDNTGSHSSNVEISQKRAKFVRDYLISRGIDGERISYVGYGPKKPIYSNRYKSTREGNRRIEIKILDKKKEDYSKLVEESMDDDKNKSSTMPIHTFNALFNKQQTIPFGTELVIESLQYEPNEVNVPDVAKKDLDKLIQWLKENPKMKGEIAGHTDKSGLEDKNLLLSEQRAEKVYQYLLENGVIERQISYNGYGSSKPIVSNKYQHGRDTNRRIAFKLVGNGEN